MCFRVLVVLFLSSGTAAHGAVWHPEPRNSEPASRGWISYGIALDRAQEEGRVAMTVFNQHLCSPQAGKQTETYGMGKCIKNARNQRRPSYMFTLSPPPAPHGDVVDCTADNNCTSTVDGISASNASGPFAWIVVYPRDSECATAPLRTYKLNRNSCTQLPVTGDDYWTGGCEGLACEWFSQGCAIGCESCTGDWRRNACDNVSATPTLPERFRTYNLGNDDPATARHPAGDWTRTRPWRSPGAAPVLDACGMAGGSFQNNENPGGHPPPGHTWGDRGSALPALSRRPVEWRAGSVVEVSWAIAANHVRAARGHRNAPLHAPPITPA